MKKTDFNDIRLDRHAVIEASAGTGKTHTIQNLFVRLLCETEVTYDQILVLTFTEKATGELKERIRTNIREHTGRAKKDGDEARARKLESAYENFDHAPIFTIHGFCNWVLQQYAFENQELFRSRVEDDTALYEKMLRDQMRRDWPAWFGKTLGAALAISNFPGLDNGASSWESTVIKIARFYRPGYGDMIIPERVGDVRKAMEEWLKGLGATLDEISRIAGKIDERDITRSELCAGYCSLGIREDWVRSRLANIIVPLLKLISAYRSTGEIDIAGLRSFVMSIKEDGFRKLSNSAKNAEKILPHLDMLISRLEGLRAAFLDEQLCHQLASAAIVELKRSVDRYKKERGVIAYDDMLTAVDKALSTDGPSLLLGQLRARYRYALIDEFQDTDAVQWAIFKKVFLESPEHKLFIIGDPKQAIYSFRGADVYAYIAACDEMRKRPDTIAYSLTTNWRSTEPLIGAFNTLFDKGGWFPPGKISYLAVDSPDDKGQRMSLSDDRTGRASLTVVDFEATTSAKQVGRSMAEFIAREIKRLIALSPAPFSFGKAGNMKPISPSDICVLVRTRPEAQMIESVFDRDEFNIPYSFYKKGKLYQSAEADHLAYLLGAISDPTDVSNFKKALLTPFFRIRAEDLKDYEDLPPSHPVRQLFEEWYDLASKRRWPRLFQSIMDKTGVRYAQIREALGERRITNYEHILENLECQAASENLDFNGILEQLNLYRHELEAGEEEFNLHRLETEKDKVKILTIHAAKGLEFPIVFIGGGFTAFGGREAYLKYHDSLGRIVYDLINGADDVSSYKEELLDEERRIFYVALTRTMCKLYVPRFQMIAYEKWGGPVYRIIAPALEGAFGRSADSRVETIMADAHGHEKEPPRAPKAAIPIKAKAKAAAIAMPKPLFPDTSFSFSDRKLEIESFSAIHSRMAAPAISKRRIAKEFALHEEPVETPEAGKLDDDSAPATESETPQAEPVKVKALPAGADTGSMLHEILERIDFVGVGRLSSGKELLSDPETIKLIDAKLARYGFLGERLYRRDGLDDAFFREETAKTIWNALNTPLAPDGAFSLGKLAKEDGIHELSFNYPLPRGKDLHIPEVKHSREGFLIGFIDLVFRHKDRYYIIDWKSNYLEDGYGPEAVKKSMDEADYHLQYKLYTIAVVRWLKAHIKDFDYGKHFGGVYYVYLRGRNGKDPEQGLFYYRPKDEAEIKDYERMLYKMVNSI